jgi:hypothetical protein
VKKKFLDYAKAQLAKAEHAAEKWRSVVAACEEALATEIILPPVDKPFARRQRVDYFLSQAIAAIPQGVDFTADTVFTNFPKAGFDRNKTKVSISYRLSQMEKNGELKRIGWGVYVKV